MSSTKQNDKLENVYPVFEFKDLDNATVTVKPWSFNKSRSLTKLIGNTIKVLKEQVPNFNLSKIFEHFDVICTVVPDALGELCYRTIDKEEAWLDKVDNAMIFRMAREIIDQNFTGARVTEAVGDLLKKDEEETMMTQRGSGSSRF